MSTFPQFRLGDQFTVQTSAVTGLSVLYGAQDSYSLWREVGGEGEQHCYYLCDRSTVIALFSYRETAILAYSFLQSGMSYSSALVFLQEGLV